jgi:adenosylcobinamide-GDP ribazoletransferase
MRATTAPGGGLLLAVQFLTVLPVRLPRVTDREAPRMAAALPWFPLVGALIGMAQAGLDVLLRPVLTVGARNVILIAFAALVTGMLHLDGFIDCCDALLGTRTAERRLAILRDSRVGAYGVVGGGLILLARYAALGALDGDLRLAALALSPLLGRWAMVFAVTRFRYAREAGAGARFRGGRMRAATAWALILALGVVLALLRGWPVAARFVFAGLAWLLALNVALLWSSWATKRLGGLTGDTYGAANELVEVSVLLLAPVLAWLATSA